jgi:predicted metal-dependent HD superfamily phosphohydrolase/outer membrane protein assembly factor BamB
MELRDRWNRLLPDAKPLGQDLLGRYAEPHRAYHDQRHLTEMLDTIDELAGEATDPDSVRLAAWFHDAVYDPQAPAGQNEESSAQLAEAELAAYGLDASKIAEVVRLIRLTAGHSATDGDPNGAVLCDADLRILAADRDRYDEYVAGVRREYAHVPDRDFAHGRAEVLQRIGGGRIYTTGRGKDAWERPARDNLYRELARLRGTEHRWGGLVPLLYLGAALGLVLGASVMLGRAVAAAPSWPVTPGSERGFGWWAPVIGVVLAGLMLAAWVYRARSRAMLAFCAPLAVIGLGGLILTRLRWPAVTGAVAMSERWPYLLLASIATLLGGILLAVGCRLSTSARYSARPPRVAGPAAVALTAALATVLVLLAGEPFVQARLQAANTFSQVARTPPSADLPVRLDGELAWTGALASPGAVIGTAGGLAVLRPDGVVTLDAATGGVRWSYRRADITNATGPQGHGLVLSADQRTLAVNLPRNDRTGSIDLPTYAVLDAVTGAVLAEIRTRGTAVAVDAERLIVADGDDLIGYPLGHEDAWRVRPDCPVTRAELVAGTVVVVGDCATAGRKTVRGLDAADGSQRWIVDVGRRLSRASGTTETTSTGDYRIGDLVAVPDSRQVAGVGWSPEDGGTLYEWVLDTARGTLTWSLPMPGSPRSQPGSGACVPALKANQTTLVLIACRPAPAGSGQVYDIAASNPLDGTQQWYHLVPVPAAVQSAWYPRNGFTLMNDGRVVTMVPSAKGCVPMTIGTTGVQTRPFVSGEVAVPTVDCDRPQATLAGTGRPVLAGTTYLLALR